jgi:hypothetical protein
MIFLDGGTAQIKQDLAIWSIVKSCNLLCGHDYCEEYPEVMKAVDRTIGKVEVVDGTSIWYRC